ncbi:MAG: DNA-directed RNA polymerase subunit beta' [Candidatus Hodgkinia cicadicola]
MSLASTEQVLSWSYGEVTNPVGFNLITGKPEVDSLFCPKIFGPIKDNECLCSVPTPNAGICSECGVELTNSWHRRRRFGHIELAAPVVHTWFYKHSPSVLALLLDLPSRTVQMIVDCELHLVIASRESEVKAGELVSTKTLYDLNNNNAQCEVAYGAQAILALLSKVDIWSLKCNLSSRLAKLNPSSTTANALVRKLELINAFIKSSTDPRLIVLNVLPVLPAGLRPALVLKNAKYASSDLNELYRQVIIKNRSVKTLDDELDAQIRSVRELQRSVDALFDNSKTKPQTLGYNNYALKSLTDLLKGKSGRFRQNLLGKRVDYSGRSVIAPGPELDLNECGLPKIMAFELFKPFLRAKAMMFWKLNNVHEANTLLKASPADARWLLEEVVRWHPVLLNRAPTLHKLSFQAFKVRIVDSKVIRLHPLVCAGFNADFDGDQMAVHVPLTIEARAEAAALMMSTNNVLHPAHGSPSILPTQDIILGLYYMSLVSTDTSSMCFSSYSDVSAALLSGLVKLSTKVRFRVCRRGDCVLWLSTPGRLLFNELIPTKCGRFYDAFCPPLTKAYVYDLIDDVFRVCGVQQMTQFCLDIMELGFKHARMSGISIGKSDFPDFSYKRDVLSNVSRAVNDLSADYRVSDRWELWANAVELIANGVDVELAQRGGCQTSIQIVANSGARGTKSQISQLVGLKGFVYGFDGKLCLMPVLSSYMEGLSAIEFFYTAYGSRRGLIDTALKTATSGYFTRKLVEVARDCTITKLDCNTVNGIRFSLRHSTSFIKRSLIGRILAKPILEGSETLFEANTVISNHNVNKLIKHAGKSVTLRSPVTCGCVCGVCAQCYGIDLSTNGLVCLGQAVGIIAAQSIGEPGTQLTLRAFHDTGVAKKRERATRVHVLSPRDGKLRLHNIACVFNTTGDAIVIGKACTLTVECDGVTCFRHKLGLGERLVMRTGARVRAGSLLCLGRGAYATKITLISGFLSLSKFIEGINSRVELDRYMGTLTRIAYANALFGAKILISAAPAAFAYKPKNGEQLIAIPGAHVNIGDSLTWLLLNVRIHERFKQQLSFVKLANLFENRVHTRARALVSPFSGRIRIGEVNSNDSTYTYVLDPLTTARKPLAFVVKGKPLNISANTLVRKGKMLIPGEVDLQKLAAQSGLSALVRCFVASVQKVYDSQGVSINSKHIEVVLSQMIKSARVISGGNSEFRRGQHVDWATVIEINRKFTDLGFELVRARRLILGVSRVCATQCSLLSAMAYQGSVGLLVKAAISSTRFRLLSIKERVMLGALAPIGTGAYRNV